MGSVRSLGPSRPDGSRAAGPAGRRERHQGADQLPHVAAPVNAEWLRGSTTFLYEIWDTDMEQSWAGALPDHVELVGHRELIDLQT